MNIYKLKYNNKEEGLADFFFKGVLVEFTFDDETIVKYGEGVSSVVDLGILISEPPTFDSNGNVITDVVYLDGYFFDIMTDNTYDFGANEVFPINPLHTWFGLDPNNYIKP